MTISKLLLECLVDFNLDERVSIISIDNSTTNDGVIDASLEKLGFITLSLECRFLYMRCCAHILNLIVKDGLNIIDHAIKKVPKAIVFWIASPKRVGKFEDACRLYEIVGGKKLKVRL